MRGQCRLGLVTVSLAAALAASAEAEWIVRDKQTRHVIYHAAAAPESVRTAAGELQRVIGLATEATLPINTEPASPMICLGDNEASRKAGIDAAGIPDEGFRIVIRGPDIYIVGKDWPDDAKKWATCDSTGTLFGVYDFLERVVGARWLMPGPLGEDVPDHRAGLDAPPMDISDAPAVPHRTMDMGRRNHEETKVWLRRRRMGRSIAPSWGHNFAKHPSTEVLKEHPEYMPLQADGTREQVVGNRAWGHHEHKLCLSNHGLITAFADSLNEYLDKYPNRQGASAAPADGGRWCLCKDCQAFKLTGPSPEWGDYPPYGYSMTPLVLQFYNGVARLVAAKHPDRLVGGLIYHEYVHPPPQPVALEPNVFLGIAINAGYGFKFYKPESAATVAKLIPRWAAVCRHLGWSDYSTWMRNPFGAPLPPGLPIIRTTFPAFGRSLKVINYQGQEAWGYAGAHNYVVSRLMWNNTEDADRIYDEYLQRAYGPAAGQVRRLYQVVEDSLRAYTIAVPYPDHEIWYDSAQKVYVPIFDEMERLYAEADKQALTEAQRKRLKMMGDNLVVLHWNLRNAGLLKETQKSVFFREDKTFRQFMADRADSLAFVDLSFYRKWRWQTILWAPETRALEIAALPQGAAAPQIDGDLGDEAWARAGVADQFRLNEDERQPAGEQTVARALYDDKNLYLSWQCSAAEPGRLRSACAIANSVAIFSDDVVEAYIQPDRQTVVHAAMNPAGVLFVQPETPAQGAAKVGNDFWSAEMAIPLQALRPAAPPRPGDAWRGNLARRKVGPPIQHSAWNRVEERLGDERAFGVWRFGGKP